MGIFWCDIKYVEVDVIWLLKVTTHLDKLEKIQSKIKRKKLGKYPWIPYFRKWFSRDLMNTFRFSNLNMILMHFGILNFQTSQNLYTLLTINKGSSVFRTSSFSQISQDESAVCNFVKPGGNEIINSAENIPDIEEKQGKRNFNDIATFKGEWLEGKFVNSNVINLSRRSLSKSEISLLS